MTLIQRRIKQRSSTKNMCVEMTVRNMSYARWLRVVSEALETLRQCTDNLENFYVCFDVQVSDADIQTVSTKRLSVHTVKDLWDIIKEANNTAWAELYRIISPYIKPDSGILSHISNGGEVLEMKIYNGDKLYISVRFRDLYVSVAVSESLASLYDSDITEDNPIVERRRFGKDVCERSVKVSS